MRKSGLQKDIASIFSDVPIPQKDAQTGRLPIQQQAASDGHPESDSTHIVQPSEQNLGAQQQNTLQTSILQAETVRMPVVSTLRPRPLPKKTIKPPKQKSGQNIVQQVKKLLYGSAEGQMDQRQKKMTILVGLLAVVFAGVLFITLGGLGQKKSGSVNADPVDTGSASATQSQTLQQWQIPEAIPAKLRDPMKPQVNQTEANPAAGSGQMIVKGIVFSQDNPSAIVDGEIVRQGESINGVIVIAINKDSVEFEKDGRRWTQQVQR